MDFLDGADDPGSELVLELKWVGEAGQPIEALAALKDVAKAEVTRAKSGELRARWMIRYLHCIACAAVWQRACISEAAPSAIRESILELESFLCMPPRIEQGSANRPVAVEDVATSEDRARVSELLVRAAEFFGSNAAR